MYGAERERLSLGERILGYFPDRQIYFRSNGEVRFVELSTRTQLLGAAVVVGAVGWVLFTSTHFLMRDAVLEAREQTILEMTAEISDKNSTLGSLRRQVLARTERLEQNQRYLNALMADEPSGQLSVAGPLLEEAEFDLPEEQSAAITPTPQDAGATTAEPAAQEQAASEGEAAGPAIDEAPAGEDAAAAEGKQSSLVNALFPSAKAAPAAARIPGRFQANMVVRLRRIEWDQTVLARRLIDHARTEMASLDETLSPTGIDSDNLVAYWSGTSDGAAAGGPFVADPMFEGFDRSRQDTSTQVLVELDREWLRFLKAYDSLESMPVQNPNARGYVTSRYGRRVDPFNNARAMHYGLDLGGWPGNGVVASAPGVVTKAGTWGAYGNMVEIDHGNGFKTRYGHLRRVTIKRGATVTAGTPIGELGCSGRCTSPHLHFEVWFAGKPRNPMPFIKVAQNVFEIQQRREAAARSGQN